MHLLRNIKWLLIVMIVTIIGITVFQAYWLKNTYEREKRGLEIRTNMNFRETVYKLQAAKLNVDSLMFGNDSAKKIMRLFPGEKQMKNFKPSHRQKMVALMTVLKEKVRDTANRGFKYKTQNQDGLSMGRQHHHQDNRLLQLLYEVDSLQDSIKVADIEKAMSRRLQKQNIDVPFTVHKVSKLKDDEPSFNEVVVGFSNPIAYKIELGNSTSYLFRRLGAAILLSVFIVGFTLFAFILLYNNLLKQKRLSDIKNEFISNITHELKTPIATVSVAIEALRNFNASIDPQRSKEYLDISANELQRLSLLVDKVLKLSMFEKREVDLKYEHLNMQDLIKEVTSSLRLQFEKHQAEVSISSEGETGFEGDRLHLVSVIFNLLDNAIKYSKDHPRIKINTVGTDNKIMLTIYDNGIGIPDEYKDKVFEKFFRVPTGNLHNAKGYGLGLSYVAQVVEKHRGTIKVETNESIGSKFVITLPKYKA